MQYLDFYCKIHTQGLKLSRKVVLLGSLGPSMQFWPFLINFGPIIPNFWPDLAFYRQHLDSFYKIQTQDLKLSGIKVLFGILGPSIRFWPFGPILDQLDQSFGQIGL